MTRISIKLPTYLEGEPRSLEQSIKNQLNSFYKKNTCIAEADVRLNHGAHASSEKVCEIYLITKERNMFTIQKASSFESSVVKALNKLQNQLNNIYKNIT